MSETQQFETVLAGFVILAFGILGAIMFHTMREDPHPDEVWVKPVIFICGIGILGMSYLVLLSPTGMLSLVAGIPMMTGCVVLIGALLTQALPPFRLRFSRNAGASGRTGGQSGGSGVRNLIRQILERLPLRIDQVNRLRFA